jgi:membrane-bound lytic murein transglycosylase D
MNRSRILALALAVPLLAQAGDEDVMELDDLIQAGQQWLEENVDEDVLRSFGDVDRRKVEEVLREVRRRFEGEYVIDLAPLKAGVTAVLPLLEAHEATRPYLSWLKTRLDYFDVADEFRLTILPPKPEPERPPSPAPNPSPQVERKAWRKELEVRLVPKGAAPYLVRLKPIFTARQVPAELVWVAEVESSFDTSARSPAGATGLFQLMPSTARRYGLSLRPTDERLNPEKSAAAAARHLRYLGERFRDWPLALAAYNAGEGCVQDLLDRYQTRAFDRIAAHLPAETQMYVPKVEATIFRREGVALSDLELPRRIP